MAASGTGGEGGLRVSLKMKQCNPVKNILFFVVSHKMKMKNPGGREMEACVIITLCAQDFISEAHRDSMDGRELCFSTKIPNIPHWHLS